MRASQAATLLGSFAWDRLCVAIFAPRIFGAQLQELASLRLSDFVSEKTPQRLGLALVVAAWLYFTEGNMIYAGLAYMAYRRMHNAPAQAAGQGAAAAPQRVD